MNPNNKKKRKYYLLRALLYAVLALVALYLFATSNFFLTKIFFPAFGNYVTKVKFSVGHASYDPFTSCLELRGVIVGNEENPFIRAKKVNCRTNIFHLLHKIMEFKCSDIDIEDVDVNFIKPSEERWSIPWLYVNVPSGEKVQFKVDFSDINISNMNIRYQQDIGYGNEPLESEINDLNVTLKHLKNGLLSPIKYNGAIKIKSTSTGVINNANIFGVTRVNLGDWCIPSHINLSSTLTDIYAGVRRHNIAGRKLTFDFDVKRDGKYPTGNVIDFLRARDIVANGLDSEFNASGSSTFIRLTSVRI